MFDKNGEPLEFIIDAAANESASPPASAAGEVPLDGPG